MNESSTPTDDMRRADRLVAASMRVAAGAVILASVVIIAVAFTEWANGSGLTLTLIPLIIGLVGVGGGLLLFRHGPSMARSAKGLASATAGNQTPRRAMDGLSRIFPIIGRIVGGVVVVIGTLMFGAGIQGVLNGRPFSDGVTTQGVVVDSVQYESTFDDEKRIRYRDVVEYEAEGETYRLDRNAGTAEPGAVGEVYEVSYRPSDPGGGRLVGIGVGVGTLFIGLIFLSIGLLAVWGSPRYARFVRRYHGLPD